MEPLRPGDPPSAGRYRLAGRLGGGGMGEVFLGYSPGGRPVAVKVVRAGLASDAGFRRRFAHEVEAARRVGGFHTAQVVDADVDADPPWLVTAYVPGPSLEAVLVAFGPLPERSLRVLGGGLAEALEAIHAAGLVHRDLKPSNILLAADGPRVIDFGIARAAEGTALTADGSSIGTPGFMAPEYLAGEAAGPPADVFALGAVLCHAAGVRPFGEGNAATLLYRVVHAEPDLAGLPAGLRGLVADCLAKDPGARPEPPAILDRLGLAGMAGAVGDWLPEPVTRLVQDERAPTLAPTAVADGWESPAGPAPAATAPAGGRRRWPVWAAAGGAMAAAVVVGGLVAWSLQSTPPRQAVATPTVTVSTAASTPVARCTPGGRTVTDPEGRVFPTWTCDTERRGPLYEQRTDGATTGYITSSRNWFACQEEGDPAPQGRGTTWLYTQGDERYENQGWGWFPAASVSSTWQDGTVPDIPACTF
ncbi:serine/threonine-protein kinase [Actinomadura parmotrematis]|uniref:Serine/threonine protein kinase n=1 Tax=Actinomadura parmotrematis TaxID=2864039 RepID=A0ABS7G4N4_9ACTN|nr:serine/threonine-protein kinase [Actinomadura parmotrematis]MBW8486593.1 serine/threonine protein kinase [Actinomadura parmotrematis]